LVDEKLTAVLDDALRHARTRREEAVADLFEELRIPSISTVPESRGDVRRNADWVRHRLDGLGMTTSLTEVTGGKHPVLQADSPPVPGAPTLTIYGHYDVQPPDPVDEWRTPPFEPTVRDGFVYARGCADNKGNHMAAIKAAEYLVAAGGLPLNLRFLIEGEEEIAGPSLPRYIADNAARLKSDFSLIWDGGFSTANKPVLVTGLRGMLYTQLDAVGAGVDLHSGSFGGVAPNPLNTLAHVISALKGRDGRITVPGFYDDVQKPSADELKRLDRPPDLEDLLKREMGVEVLEGETDQDPSARIGYRPTLDVNGITGGFTAEGIKTVIPARGSAKVSMRLVPDQDPDKILGALIAHVDGLTTPGVKISTRRLADARPLLLPGDHAAARATTAAFEAAFGEPAVFAREGGSIPVAAAFEDHVGGQLVCSGIIQADSRPHSPNEHLSLDHYHRGTEMLIHLMVLLARR
jgi:acetylornithine deacetylase/succinyl-diaminopimelate desuccinylase-like protein